MSENAEPRGTAPEEKKSAPSDVIGKIERVLKIVTVYGGVFAAVFGGLKYVYEQVDVNKKAVDQQKINSQRPIINKITEAYVSVVDMVGDIAVELPSYHHRNKSKQDTNDVCVYIFLEYIEKNSLDKMVIAFEKKYYGSLSLGSSPEVKAVLNQFYYLTQEILIDINRFRIKQSNSQFKTQANPKESKQYQPEVENECKTFLGSANAIKCLVPVIGERISGAIGRSWDLEEKREQPWMSSDTLIPYFLRRGNIVGDLGPDIDDEKRKKLLDIGFSEQFIKTLKIVEIEAYFDCRQI